MLFEIPVLQNGNLPFFELLMFAIGITAITFIAIVLLLDLQPQKEPVSLPDKKIS